MNLAKLATSNMRVLTEADYDLPEQMVDNLLNNQGNDQQNPDNQSQPEPQGNPEPPENQEPPQNEPETQGNQQDDPNNQEDQNNDGGEDNPPDDPNYDIQDDYDVKDDIPKLKILKSLSDEEYKLNNIKCFQNFKELYSKVENTVNNNIMDTVTKNARQRQIVNMVHNNLSGMLDDLDNYMIFKFGDIYEDNILAYVTYLKRYHVAMRIIGLVVKENMENSEDSNK